MSAYESRTSSLESEVTALKTELMENESKFHLLHAQLNITDCNIKKVRGRLAFSSLLQAYCTAATMRCIYILAAAVHSSSTVSVYAF